MSDEELDLEFAFTSWSSSCRDLYSIDKCCRRPAGHDGDHAAGFGVNRTRWEE